MSQVEMKSIPPRPHTAEQTHGQRRNVSVAYLRIIFIFTLNNFSDVKGFSFCCILILQNCIYIVLIVFEQFHIKTFFILYTYIDIDIILYYYITLHYLIRYKDNQ